MRRTLQYAISLGGDTDTIASMAGALAGAYLGGDAINESVLQHCEASNEMSELGLQLHQMSRDQKSSL
jgi:poly(ADP-ribose) glycohydrolase ARH3